MPGVKWTDRAVDYAFLLSKVPGYAEVFATGKAHIKNHARDSFLAQLMDDYIEMFPGRFESMDLPGIGLSGDEPKRKGVFQEVSTISTNSIYANLVYSVLRTGFRTSYGILLAPNLMLV
jgi:hypothetical protein